MDVVMSSLKNLSLDPRVCSANASLIGGLMSHGIDGPTTPVQPSRNAVETHVAHFVEVENGSEVVNMFGVADIVQGTPNSPQVHGVDDYPKGNQIHEHPVRDSQTNQLFLLDFHGVGGEYFSGEGASERCKQNSYG